MQQRCTVVKKKFYLLALIAATLTIISGLPAAQASPASQGTAELSQRARVGRSIPTANQTPPVSDPNELSSLPITLSDGGTLEIVVPSAWQDLGLRVAAKVNQTRVNLNQLFGDLPAFHTTVKLLDEESFFRSTGAPRWTNALYYRGQVIVPLTKENLGDDENLQRSIRHEYTHAAIHALSGGRCPGWLDEGIAQWFEGSENPALAPALRNWLEGNSPVPLTRLQVGFTRLDNAMVPAAYAQSLYAATTMSQAFGYRSIRTFLNHLKSGTDRSRAFSQSFGLSEERFEQALGKSLKSWSHATTLVAHDAADVLDGHR